MMALLCIFILQYVPYISTQAIVPGYLDFDNLPDTNFSCEAKVIGGYYADIETGCQMFHVCTIGQKGEITDIKFLCLNGTVFDQETRVCERVDEVDCSKTEGFYDLNLELYGNNAALSFPEEEEEEDDSQDGESQENAETSDRSPHNQSPKQKTSTSKPLTTSSPSSAPLTPHPASTTTTRPIHPYVPTTTAPLYKSSHFHSTTSPSISAFLAINNAFSNSNQGKHSSQYDDEEEEEDEESITEQILQHHFPVTTIRTHGSVSQPKVKIQGTGESGFLRNQQNPPKHLYPTPKSELVPPTSTHPSHLYSHSYHHDDIKDQSAHSKHQHNTQLILQQQRNSENKNHHGFKPVTSTENRSQFLFSSSTQQPPVYFTTKTPGFSSTVRSSTLEPYPIHAIGPQPPQQSSNNPSFLPQTNAHQVPSASGATQSAQASQQPLSFQFSNSNNRQGHQLLTTPSVAVIATTSSTSSSSSVKAGPTRKTSISPEISLTSFIGNNDKRTSSQKNSSLPVQVLSETSSPASYEEYQEGDVATDPFFQDVPRLSKSVSSSTSSVVHRKKRSAKRNKRQLGLPTEIFDTGSNRARGGTSRDFHQESQRQRTLRYRARLESTSTLPLLETGTPARRVSAVTELPEPEIFRVRPQSARVSHTEVSSPASMKAEHAAQDHSDHNSRRIVRVRARRPLHRNSDEHGEEVTTFHTVESVSPVTDRTQTNSPAARRDFGNRRGQAQNVTPRGRQANTTTTTPRRRVVHRFRSGASNRGSKVSSGDDSLRERKAENVTEDVVVEPPPPTTPLPETNFTCNDKIPGGYYADLEADCQLFHICSQGRHGRIKDNKFLCGPGTRFNQRSRTCQARESVDCNISASLYYLNSHFKVEPPESLKPELDFEPKKVHRVKRKAAKGSSEPEYSIDNIPETSFRCSDKGKEGLYADVETQCKVFHLCRVISGKLTLESSFVCPPGTVFNQPEGSCDTTKEVDCELYSAPEHSFRKTPGSGNKNKGRNKRNSNKISEYFTRTRAKRDSASGKDKVDYYDYVDDNYEAYIAHAANPVHATPPTKDNHTRENSTDVYDYVYDEDYDYETENDTNQDSTEIPQVKQSDFASSTEVLQNITHEINSTAEEFDPTTVVPPDDTQEIVDYGNSGLVINSTDITDLEETYTNETQAHVTIQNETMSDHQQVSNDNGEVKINHQSKNSTNENNLKTKTDYYQDSVPIATGSAEENDEEYYEYEYDDYDNEYPVNSTNKEVNNNVTLTETNSKKGIAETETSTLEDVIMTTDDPTYISEEDDKISPADDDSTVPNLVNDTYSTKRPDINPKDDDTESGTGPYVSQDSKSVLDSAAPEILTTTPSVREYKSSELPLLLDEPIEDYEADDYIDTTTNEMIPYDITTTAETLNEITPPFAQEGRMTRNDEYIKDSEHVQEEFVTTTTTSTTTTTTTTTAAPTTSTIPTTPTIPSLFRPVKSHKVFRNRFAVPEPPPVSIRPVGQPTASRRNIQRGTTTRNRNAITGKNRGKKTNKYQDDSLSDNIKETVPLKISTEVPTTPAEMKDFSTENPSLVTKAPKKNTNTIVKTGYTKEESLEDTSATSECYNSTYATHSPKNETRQTGDTSEQVTTSSTIQSKDNSLVSQTNVLDESDPTSDITTKLPRGTDLGYTLSSATSQSSVPKDTSFVCTGKEMHQYHPDPEDCRMFHYCSPGFHSHQFLDFRFKCENGTVFEAKSQKCVSEYLVPNCSVSAGHKTR